MTIIGLDLSGPSNAADTACAVFDVAQGLLHLRALYCGLNDGDVLSVVSRHAGSDLTIGLDAPLSYEDGGGDRARDRELRRVLTKKGLPSGTIMTPTMTRMAYLTLRGVHLAGLLQRAHPAARIVEVHPMGSLVLAGLDPALATRIKSDEIARLEILKSLPAMGMRQLPTAAGSDHELAALGAAFAAWQWRNGTPSWQCAAQPPHHPYPMAC
jgi:predicted nuclease with RNAse H fold